MAKRYIEVDEPESEERGGGGIPWWLIIGGGLVVLALLGAGEKTEVNAASVTPAVQVYTNVDVAPAEVYVQPAEVIVNVPVQQEPQIAAPVNAMPRMDGIVAQDQAPMIHSEQNIVCDVDIPAANGEPHVVLLGQGRRDSVTGECVRQ